MKLDGKVALITGSTQGAGAQMARQFAAAGAAVVVTGRSAERGAAVVDEIRRAGGRAAFARADLTTESDVEAMARVPVSEFGGLHVLVNCAAPMDELTGGTDRAIADLPTENFRKFADIGIYGLFWTLKYAIPHMKTSGGGSIVNISSGVTTQGFAGMPAYTMTKGAMNALTLQIAVEYAGANIRCNAIIAGTISGGPTIDFLLNHPVAGPAMRAGLLTRVGTAADIANVAQFLASDASANMSGALVQVDGGARVKAPMPDFAAIFGGGSQGA
ncbi:MAG: SDR family oxidoreductase [Steroidobacteraceae bacterium]